MPRGRTAAAKAAERYLSKYPESSAQFIAKKFGIDTSTVYRSAWWQNRPKQDKENSK